MYHQHLWKTGPFSSTQLQKSKLVEFKLQMCAKDSSYAQLHIVKECKWQQMNAFQLYTNWGDVKNNKKSISIQFWEIHPFGYDCLKSLENHHNRSWWMQREWMLWCCLTHHVNFVSYYEGRGSVAWRGHGGGGLPLILLCFIDFNKSLRCCVCSHPAQGEHLPICRETPSRDIVIIKKFIRP